MIRKVIDFSQTATVTCVPSVDTVYIINSDTVGEGKNNLVITLGQPGLVCHIKYGIQLGAGRTGDVTTTINHTAPDTTSDTQVRVVLSDGGVSNYVGKINIKNSAQGASARLNEKILVVGEGTKNHAEPTLEIEANNVTASHASSTGRIDSDQLYYLQSRGLAKPEARDVIVEAFLASVRV